MNSNGLRNSRTNLKEQVSRAVGTDAAGRTPLGAFLKGKHGQVKSISDTTNVAAAARRGPSVRNRGAI
jgi:hypothetical protein